MNKALPMFNDRNFWLSCTTAQTLSYFKQKGIPVEIAFNTSLDSAAEVFTFVKDNIKAYLPIGLARIRTRYKPRLVERIPKLGIIERTYSPTCFEEFESVINSSLNAGELVLMTTQTFYLPHHHEFYQTKFATGYHTVILVRSDISSEIYVILDDSPDLKSYISYEYDRNIICEAFNNSRKIIKCISCNSDFDVKKMKAESIDEMKRILGLGKMLPSYHLIYEFFYSPYKENNREISLILNNTFAIIRGTRILFSKFLNLIRCPSEIDKRLHEIVHQLELAENVSMKNYNEGKFMGQEKIKSICNEIEIMEKELVELLEKWLT